MKLPLFPSEPSAPTERARLAFDALAKLDLPSERDEMWRYTDLSSLDLSAFHPVRPDIAVEGVDAGDYGEGAGLVEPDLDFFTALNGAFGEGIALRLPRGGPKTVRVTLHSDEPSAAQLPQLRIEADPGSETVVVVQHTGSPGLSVPVIEAVVGENAQLALVDVQSFGPEVVHVALLRAQLSHYSRFRSFAVGLGGRISRLRAECEMAEPDAESEMLGLYFGEQQQHFDFRTLQEHMAPRCRSQVLYKGAVSDTARAVYSGLIYVAKGASKTDGFQTNRNLVLSKGAWAESIPKLEILTNDVKCSHASAVGPLDEEQIYYLESRGIDPGVARRLVVFGFFEEVLRRLPEPSVEAGIRLAVVDKFRRAEKVLA